MGWPGATLGAKVIEAQALQKSGQEPARSHALPDSFKALTQSFKVTATMTSWASLVWHVTEWAGLHALEPRARRSPVSSYGRCGQHSGCSPGMSRARSSPTWSLAQLLDLLLAHKDILDTIIRG